MLRRRCIEIRCSLLSIASTFCKRPGPNEIRGVRITCGGWIIPPRGKSGTGRGRIGRSTKLFGKPLLKKYLYTPPIHYTQLLPTSIVLSSTSYFPVTTTTMGTAKKERNRLVRQGKSGTGFDNIKIKGENFYRSAKKIKVLNMRTRGEAQRNADGEITKSASYQSRERPVARVEPNRKWFTNTRVISQDSLTAFRSAMEEKAKDPYQVLLKSNKLPMTLIRDGSDTNGLKQHKAKMTVESSPFAEVFGPRSQRKRVKLGVSSILDLAEDSEKSMDTYHDRLEQAHLLSGTSGTEAVPGDMAMEMSDALSLAVEPVFSKGQSKRIWNELYKVLDSSDVVIHVLDARDPLGTRCRRLVWRESSIHNGTN